MAPSWTPMRGSFRQRKRITDPWAFLYLCGGTRGHSERPTRMPGRRKLWPLQTSGLKMRFLNYCASTVVKVGTSARTIRDPTLQRFSKAGSRRRHELIAVGRNNSHRRAWTALETVQQIGGLMTPSNAIPSPLPTAIPTPLPTVCQPSFRRLPTVCVPSPYNPLALEGPFGRAFNARGRDNIRRSRKDQHHGR